LYKKVTIIRPQNQSFLDGVREFWEYRELLYMLTVRRISVRYKQTVIGIAWVLLQPLVAMTIFSVIFGKFAKIPSDGVPYPIFCYSALVLWSLFAEGINRASSSLIEDAKLITKVYFPRLIIPLSAVGSAWIDFVVSLFLLLPLTYVYGLRPTWSLLLIPPLMFVTVILATGVGMVLAAFNVRYRDFQYLVPFLIQILLYSSPIIYSAQIVPKSLLFLYYLNPMAGLLDLFRFAVTGQTSFNLYGLAWSVISTILVFILGSFVFRSVERSFADFI